MTAKTLLAAVLGFLVLCGASHAQDSERQLVGWAQIFNNDYLGDGKDRWRTGSYRLSRTMGRDPWAGQRPLAFGDLLEYRFGAEIIAPASLSRQSDRDRPYAGLLSFGVHSHFQRGGADISIGFDLYATGPQTGIDDFQTGAHDLFGATEPQVLDTQIGDGIYPTALAEVAKTYSFGPNVMARPFVEVQGGVETFARLGADVMIGRLGQDELLLRDTVTGQILRGSTPQSTGGAFVLGGDWAYLADSRLLPGSDAAQLKDRGRLRAGYHWQGAKAGMFYGATWLGQEFEDQPEGQVVGSIRLQLNF
ncbi:lipid A-modifier LpxR family protein [Algirhabdus cladophorae]|uniref:lipid A-modifier LpxR family protein n=1 Tax=Algirhabdus cladophorae TaxID=3377108 RepID=UPI003B845ED9